MSDAENESSKRSAAVLVEVYPVGKPGTVGITATNLGPEPLSTQEAVELLRTVADQMESLEDPRWQ